MKFAAAMLILIAGSDAWIAMPSRSVHKHDIARVKLLKTCTLVSIDPAVVDAAAPIMFKPRGITTQDSIVFAIGVLPFAWATVEFWRRIAVGESFGTGKDSVIIGEDLNPESSRGRRVLGKVRLGTNHFAFRTLAVTRIEREDAHACAPSVLRCTLLNFTPLNN